MKNIYIGTDKVLRERLNQIYKTDKFTGYTKYVQDKKEIQHTVKKLVEPLIIKELLELVNKKSSVDEFLNRKRIKGMEYVLL